MIIKGNFLYTPSIDEMVVKEQAYLLIENGKVKDFYDTLPEEYRQEKVIDYGEAIIIPAFNDVHIHAERSPYTLKRLGNRIIQKCKNQKINRACRVWHKNK